MTKIRTREAWVTQYGCDHEGACEICAPLWEKYAETKRLLHKIAYNRGLLEGVSSCHVNDRCDREGWEDSYLKRLLDDFLSLGFDGRHPTLAQAQAQGEVMIQDALNRGQIKGGSVAYDKGLFQTSNEPIRSMEDYRSRFGDELYSRPRKGYPVPPKSEPRNTSVPPILGRAMHDAKAGERVDVVIGHGQIAPKVTASQNVCKGDSLVSDPTGKVKPFRTGPKTWEGTVVSINALSIHVRCALGVISVNHPEGERWYEGMIGTKVTIMEKDPYGWKLKQGYRSWSYEWPKIIEGGKPKAKGGIVKPKTRSEFVDMLTDEATKNPPKPFGRLYVAGKDAGKWDTNPPKETKEVEIKDMEGKPFKITLRIGGKEFVHTGTLQPMPEPEPQLWEGDQA